MKRQIEPEQTTKRAASVCRKNTAGLAIYLAGVLSIDAYVMAPPAWGYLLPGLIGRQDATLAGFKMARDFSLNFNHTLGAAEAQRRVAAQLEVLRGQFADKIGSSSVIWNGNEAQVNVSAFAQNASGHVTVSDTNVQIQVRLPFILSPLSGKIETFLTNLAAQTLQP